MSIAAISTSKNDHMFWLMIDSVVDYAIYLLDPKGMISTWNSGAERIKGYTAAEVIGQSFAMFFAEEDRRLGSPEWALNAAREHGRFESEGWRVRKDGSHFWALAVISAVRDEGGHLVGFAKVTRDLTERRRSEQDLLNSERQFRLLVQGMTDYAIFMLDPNGAVTNWNAGAQRIKGYDETEIIGHHFSRFYTEQDRIAGVPQRALVEAEMTGRFEAEGWRVRKDGSRFWANVVIDAIRDESGRLLGFGKVTRDITERREAQRAAEESRAKLAQSQKLEALGQLTGGVAHDFNNILQVISSGLTLAAKLPPGSVKLNQIFAEMQNAATRGESLTKQLLSFSRQAPLRPETVDTARQVEEAVGLFGHILRPDIKLDVQIDEGILPIRIDTGQFEVALLNLAVNARDAMPGRGTLQVRVRSIDLRGEPQGLTGPFVAVSVRDTGAGIPEEVLGRIFEPFFTTKPVGKGTGLGLSQVHGFARQAGGEVTLSSKVGEGTEVTILLPAVTETLAERPPLDAQEGKGEPLLLPKGLRILVVDDDAAVGRLTVGMLEGAGHYAVAAADPETALQWLAKGEKFDLVLTDVLMPGGMNGIDFGREIRRHWANLPVLLTTGYAGDVNFIQSDFPVLYKPFTAIELTHAMNEVL